MGFFESLDIEEYDREYDDRILFQRMKVYFWPHRQKIVIIFKTLVLLSLSGAALPIIVARGLDILSQQIKSSPADQHSLSFLILLIVLILIASLMDWSGNWIRRRKSAEVIGDVVQALRMDAFHSSIEHDLSFYDRFSSGRIVSRITSDTREFGQVILLLSDLVTEISQAVILAITVFIVDWRLALMVFCFLPPLYFFARFYRQVARRITQRGMRAMGNVNAAIKETVSGIAIAKNFRQEAGIYADFESANLTSYNVNLKRGLLLAAVYPILNALAGLATASIVYFGGLRSIEGLLTAGSFYLFIMTLDRFWSPVVEITGFWAQVQSGLSSAERVFALIDTQSDVVQIGNLPAKIDQAKIEFVNVNFHYTNNEQILQNFNLSIAPGENLAVVGHTGAGKSSIAKLIARFYEFQEGQILIDGRDIRMYDLNAYRSRLGIVSQNSFLFSGTVLENIHYARPDVTEEEILSMAYQIGNGEWLETLTHGLATEVGERGARLSMGQRQLVCLLRVLVQHPAIFILDEATASVDPFTEWQIQQAIQLILKRSTSILIAHRLSTVKAADRIIVLEKGMIIEEGNHKRLMTDNGHYAELYNTYFRHQSLSYIDQVREFVHEN